MVEQECKQTQIRESICTLEKNSGSNNDDSLLSPGFKSVAALAGWDEEALLLATLIVEDTPEREVKHKKRTGLQFKTPPTNSRRKRRNQRRSPNSIPIVALDLDEEETVKEESKTKKTDMNMGMKNEKAKNKDEGMPAANPGPCMDKLREELSCAICLEICYEPSTTPCGHSFCKKCLKSCADRCGKKCPKCRQLISNGRSCTVNTVLWNTIQLLFPREIEPRKAAAASKIREDHHSPERTSNHHTRNRNIQPIRASSRAASHGRREVPVLARDDNDEEETDGIRFLRSSRRNSSSEARRTVPSQDGDAALALRLQREEFMVAFRGGNVQSQSSVSMARANLRAMASRAMTLRLRDHQI